MMNMHTLHVIYIYIYIRIFLSCLLRVCTCSKSILQSYGHRHTFSIGPSTKSHVRATRRGQERQELWSREVYLHTIDLACAPIWRLSSIFVSCFFFWGGGMKRVYAHTYEAASCLFTRRPTDSPSSPPPPPRE